MAAANMTNMSQIFKTIWHDELEATFYKEAPLLAMVPKDTGWSGANYDVVINYGPPSGRSSRFETAYARRNSSKVTKMSLQTFDNFSLWSVDHKAMQASRNDAGAVERLLTGELTRSTKKFKRSVCWQLWGNGGGAIGRISTTTSPSGTTITLQDKRAIRNIESGDFINCYSNNGAVYGSAGTLRAGGPLQVDTVNATAGTITLTSPVPAAWATGDYLFPEDDYQNVMYGVDTYISNVADASVGTVAGMNRAVMRHRLAGTRTGGKGLQVEEATKKLLTRLADLGGDPSHVFMNTDDWYSFEMANQTKKFGSALNEKVGVVGFSGIEMTKPGGGSIRVYPDADCPKNLIYALNLDDCLLRSMGEYPGFLTVNGNKYETEPSANAWIGRQGGYAQFVIHNPGLHGVCDLTLQENS